MKRDEINKIITEGGIWIYNNTEVDFATYTVLKDGIKSELTHLNMELLKLFLLSVEKVLTRDIIKTRVWGDESLADDRNVDIQICLLRKKLGISKRELISIRSVGYKLVLR